MSRTPRLPSDFEDVVFGPQYHPENRIATHIRNQDGLRHLGRRSPVIAAADTATRVTATTSGEIPFAEVVCWYRIESLAEQRLAMTPGAPAWDDVRWAYIRPWSVDLPALPAGTIVTYRIGARRAGSDRWVFADHDAGSGAKTDHFSFMVAPGGPPAWAAGARLYHIFVDRFHPGPGRTWSGETDLRAFHGGTLSGVVERLAYIDELGFNTIWLSPIFPSPSHHGYDATDLLSIEPRFGTMAEFEALIRQAHNRGIRILLDFVPNHWSDRHPTFLEARGDPDSPFRDWYLWEEWPEKYLSFFDVRSMPKINLAAGSPARAHVLAAARFWLEKGIDGYRVDHAEGPDADFWPEFRRVCREANPEAWLFGEVGRPPPVERTFASGLDGVLDFSLEQALRQTFALNRWSLGAFESFLSAHLDFFPPEFSLPSFLDNHDTNRFLFIAEGDRKKLKLAAAVIYTLPGAPIVYYGTERGLSQLRGTDQGVGLDESRLPVDWEDESESDLAAYFRRLNEIRARWFAHGMHDRRLEYLDEDRGLYAYSWHGDGGRVLVALNTGLGAATIELPDIRPARGMDELGGLTVRSAPAGIVIDLPPQSAGIIL